MAFLSFIPVRWQATLTSFHIFCYFFIRLLFIWCSIRGAALDVSQSNEQTESEQTCTSVAPLETLISFFF